MSILCRALLRLSLLLQPTQHALPHEDNDDLEMFNDAPYHHVPSRFQREGT